MHIKFLAHGQGSAAGAVRYLLRSHDHKGVERSSIKVLRGDPAATAAVADSLSYKHKYTSAVIAFHENDAPTDAQLEQLLDDFEAQATAGLGRSRVAMTMIEHGEQNGNKHIHVLAARCDLESGKSYNIAPPSHLKRYDAVRDYHNTRNEWARPDDPRRSRLTNNASHQISASQKLSKQQLLDYCEQYAKAQQLNNREPLLEHLKEKGFEITRQGEDYISVKSAGAKRAMRLKGALFSEQDYEQMLYPPNPAEHVEHFKKLMLDEREKVREYNQKRYEQHENEAQKQAFSDYLQDNIGENALLSRFERFYEVSATETRENAQNLLERSYGYLTRDFSRYEQSRITHSLKIKQHRLQNMTRLSAQELQQQLLRVSQLRQPQAAAANNILKLADVPKIKARNSFYSGVSDEQFIFTFKDYEQYDQDFERANRGDIDPDFKDANGWLKHRQTRALAKLTLDARVSFNNARERLLISDFDEKMSLALYQTIEQKQLAYDSSNHVGTKRFIPPELYFDRQTLTQQEQYIGKRGDRLGDLLHETLERYQQDRRSEFMRPRRSFAHEKSKEQKLKYKNADQPYNYLSFFDEIVNRGRLMFQKGLITLKTYAEVDIFAKVHQAFDQMLENYLNENQSASVPFTTPLTPVPDAILSPRKRLELEYGNELEISNETATELDTQLHETIDKTLDKIIDRQRDSDYSM